MTCGIDARGTVCSNDECVGWFDSPDPEPGCTHHCLFGSSQDEKIGLTDQESVRHCVVEQDFACDLQHALTTSPTAHTVESMVVRTCSDFAKGDRYDDLMARQPT